MLEWGKPFTPIDPSKCSYCKKALTFKNRSTWFHMERKDIEGAPVSFTSLYAASKVTEISRNALRNGCKRNNKKITRRKGDFANYEIEWVDTFCRQCDPDPPKKSKGVIKQYVMPKWSWDENNRLVI